MLFCSTKLTRWGRNEVTRSNVGELDRIVISLMQELEHSHPRGIVIATSNLPQHLDHALWRRLVFRVSETVPARTAEFRNRVVQAAGDSSTEQFETVCHERRELHGCGESRRIACPRSRVEYTLKKWRLRNHRLQREISTSTSNMN